MWEDKSLIKSYLIKEIDNPNSHKSNQSEDYLKDSKSDDDNYELIYDNIKNDFNADGINDKLYVLKNKLEFASDDEDSKKSKIILYLSNNNSFDKLVNSKIFPNDSNDQFETIDIKNNYFTIKLFNDIHNVYYIEKYITFTCRKNQIILSKFSKIINEEEIHIDVSKFETISFEKYDSNDEKFK